MVTEQSRLVGPLSCERGEPAAAHRVNVQTATQETKKVPVQTVVTAPAPVFTCQPERCVWPNQSLQGHQRQNFHRYMSDIYTYPHVVQWAWLCSGRGNGVGVAVMAIWIYCSCCQISHLFLLTASAMMARCVLTHLLARDYVVFGYKVPQEAKSCVSSAAIQENAATD